MLLWRQNNNKKNRITDNLRESYSPGHKETKSMQTTVASDSKPRLKRRREAVGENLGVAAFENELK